MFWQVVLAVPLLFSRPDIVVKWLMPENDSLKIQVTGEDPILDSCLNSGSELRYVYQVQICKHRPAWFDTCQEPRRLKKHVQFDPIARSYSMVSAWDDVANSLKEESFTGKSEMEKQLRRYPKLHLSFLAFDLSEFVNSQRAYVSIRVTSDCRGQYNKTLAAISRVLSFGLAQIHGFDTGWIDFKLRPKS